MAGVRYRLRNQIARFHQQLKRKEQEYPVGCEIKEPTVEELEGVLQLIQFHDWPMKNAKIRAIEGISETITKRRFQSEKVQCVARWLVEVNKKDLQSSPLTSRRVYEIMIPSMTHQAKLHCLAKKLLLQMIDHRTTLSPAIEQAACKLYHEKYEDFTNLLWNLRDNGMKPSMNLYGMVLDNTMKCVLQNNREIGFDQVSLLLRMIVADWGKFNMETYTVILKNARDTAELMLLWGKMKKSHIKIDESVSEVLCQVYLRIGEQSFNRWNQLVPHRNTIIQVQQLLIEDFLTTDRCLSLKAVTSILHACYRAGQADLALDVFYNCCRYLMATPSGEGMKLLMCTLSKQLQRTVDTYEHLANIWQDILRVHNFHPPLWQYVIITEPVARFFDVADFRHLLNVVFEIEKTSQTKLSLEDYNYLIRSCCTAKDKDSAMHVLHCAMNQNIVPNDQMLSSLLLMIKHPSDLDWYFEGVLRALPSFNVRYLSSLQRILLSVLKRMQHNNAMHKGTDVHYVPVSEQYHRYAEVQHSFSSCFVSFFKTLKDPCYDTNLALSSLHQLARHL